MSEAAQKLSNFLNIDDRPLAAAMGVAPGAPAPVVSDPATRAFSVFDPITIASSGGVLFRLHQIFDEFDDAEAAFEAIAEELPAQVVAHGLTAVQDALTKFAVHVGKGRANVPRIPVPPMAFLAEENEPQASGAPAAGAVPPGAAATDLHWFREDLFLNEHHRHWHIVYSTIGTVDPASGLFRTKDRQGEIFVYMHKQMLARYDTERVALGLEPVEPMTDFTQPIAVGYDPNARPPANIGYASRPDNVPLSGFSASDLDGRRTTFQEMISSGTLGGNPITLTPDLLGTLLEANFGVFDPFTASSQAEFEAIINQRFGTLGSVGMNLHNIGHGAITSVPETPQEVTRVMSNPHTSLQDPVFWRWHRMVDDLNEEFAATQPAHAPNTNGAISLAADTPSPDIILLSETDLRAAGLNLDGVNRADDIAALVDARFGGANIDSDPNAANISSELRTAMLTDNFVYLRQPADGGPPVQLEFAREHLVGERFATVVRANNGAGADVDATLRLFICAADFLDGTAPEAEHRFWIELDRRAVSLSPGRNLLTLVSDESTIVRKLGGRGPFPHSAFTASDLGDEAGQPDSADDFCDCGWPMNLQLPRGTEAGMSFQLAAMISEGASAGVSGTCGSRAFCGSGFDPYPEVTGTDLGFPFDRPAAGGTLAFIDASQDIARREITIKHDPAMLAAFGLVEVN